MRDRDDDNGPGGFAVDEAERKAVHHDAASAFQVRTAVFRKAGRARGTPFNFA
jgi:hypothetical protein